MSAERSPLGGRAYLRLVGLGALIGIPAALVAALFLALVHELENWLWDSNPPWYLVIGLPAAEDDAVPAAVLAAVAAWLTMRFLDTRAAAQIETPADAGVSVASR